MRADNVEDIAGALNPRIAVVEESKECTSASEVLQIFNEEKRGQEMWFRSIDRLSSKKSVVKFNDARTNLVRELENLELRKESFSKEIQEYASKNLAMSQLVGKVWPLAHELQCIESLESEIRMALGDGNVATA